MAFSSTRGLLGAAGGVAVVPSSYLDALLYTGNGTSQSVTGAGGLPDMVWIKGRGNYVHAITDDVRGTGVYITNLDIKEQTEAQGIQSFDSDGFSVGSHVNFNQNTSSIVGWCFQKNPDMFAMRTYTGNGAPRSFSHGLNGIPEFIMVKDLDASVDWAIYHKDLNGGTNPEDYELGLNSTAAENNNTSVWNSTAPTSSLFSVGNDPSSNTITNTYLAYTFKSFEGACKVDTYSGTGSSGNSVTTGFRPRFILLKDRGAANKWQIWDSRRGDTSLIDAGSTDQESTSAANEIVDDADGFTVNGTSANINSSGNNYVYIAFS